MTKATGTVGHHYKVPMEKVEQEEIIRRFILSFL